MQPTVIFRDFEERDIDFIYKCKNDEKLNSMIAAQYHPFSYEEAAKWVHGCIGKHDSYKFWAVATNDVEQRIVGWVSISHIDYNNMSAFYHGIVIGDNDYKDGFAWIESYLFILDYVFSTLKLHRLYGENIVGHKQSIRISKAMFFQYEGVKREALYKNGKFFDLEIYSILIAEYQSHIKSGDYDISKIIDRLLTK